MRRGSVSSVLLTLLAFVAGAAVMWTARPGGHPAPAARVTTHGEWIRLGTPSGDSLRAYVAYPERPDPGPGIIVIHEIFGLTEWEPTVADRLAGAGYVAIVPDLLSARFGTSPADADSGRKLTALLQPVQVNADLDVAYDYLNGLPAVRHGAIASIGFCWGGKTSFAYAVANPRLSAAVVCYGSPPDSARMGQIRARVLGVYGENDARITASVPEVERQMKATGANFGYQVYPGTGHGFLKPGRQGSDGPQVERAWANILGFLQETFQ